MCDHSLPNKMFWCSVSYNNIISDVELSHVQLHKAQF